MGCQVETYGERGSTGGMLLILSLCRFGICRIEVAGVCNFLLLQIYVVFCLVALCAKGFRFCGFVVVSPFGSMVPVRENISLPKPIQIIWA
jgi:hypothetical protein